MLISHDLPHPQEIAEAQAYLAAIVDSSEDAIIGKTLDGIILSWNAGAERIYGYSADEVIGQSITILGAPDRQDEIPLLLQQIRQGERICHYETVRVRKDGTRIPVSLAISPIKDASGKVVGASSIARDMTQQRRNEEKQRFLTEATAALSTSLDYRTTLTTIAKMAVPYFADCCLVHLISDTQTIELVEVTHIDPEKARLMREIAERYPPDSQRPDTLGALLVHGEALLIEEVSETILKRRAYDEEHLVLLKSLGIVSGIIVPLRIGGRILGTITWNITESGRRYTSEELTLAKELAQRAALAVENARLYAAERHARWLAEQAANRMARLQAITAAVVETLTPEQTAQVLIEHALAATGAAAGSIMLLNHDGTMCDLLHASSHQPGQLETQYALPVDTTTLLSDVLQSGEPLFLETLEAYNDRHPHLTFIRPPSESRAWAILPLTAEGRVVGELELTFVQPQSFSSDDRAFMLTLAHQCGQALARARLYVAERHARKVAEQAADRTNRLQRITAALSEALTPAQVAEVIIQQGLAAFQADAGSVFLWEEAAQGFEALSFVGYPPPTIPHPFRFSIDRPGPLQDIVRSRELIIVESPEELVRRWPNLAEAQAQTGDSTTAAAPLLLEQRLLGVLYIAFRSPRRFTAEDRDFLTTLARQCAQALERARLYEIERRARAAAEATIRDRDQFLSIASHELKTPLTSLLGNAQLFQRRALRNGMINERDHHMLRVIIEQGRRLNRMITTLLDLSRIQAGQLSIDRAPLDLCTLTRRILDEIEPTLTMHILDYRAASQPLMIDGDELRLEQVLQNLIQNAIKYSPQGGAIEISIGQSGDHARLSVTDHGIGIPQESISQLFRRFYRAANADEQHISGMGIGLYVVKEIVALHGGAVEVNSTEGKGSTFTIWLPVCQ